MNLYLYYIIGVVVSTYFICHYRLSGRTPHKKTDAIMGMIGPFIWPAQIIFYVYLLIANRKNHN